MIKDKIVYGSRYPPLAGGGLIEAVLGMPITPSGASYPPLAGGGLIEASAIASGSLEPWWYPPLAGGGLIEAGLKFCYILIAHS